MKKNEILCFVWEVLTEHIWCLAGIWSISHQKNVDFFWSLCIFIFQYIFSEVVRGSFYYACFKPFDLYTSFGGVERSVCMFSSLKTIHGCIFVQKTLSGRIRISFRQELDTLLLLFGG